MASGFRARPQNRLPKKLQAGRWHGSFFLVPFSELLRLSK